MNTMCENLPGLCEKGEMMKQGSSIPKIHFKNEDRVLKTTESMWAAQTQLIHLHNAYI